VLAVSRPRILVTGASGLLGPYLVSALDELGEVVTLARREADIRCDLVDVGQTEAALRRVAPAIIVNAAAMTDVDRCESDPAAAMAANATAVDNLVGAATEAYLVQISTDQVYGSSGAPHREGTEAPVNAYGRTKLAGEAAARRHPHHLVLRTNLFGPSRTPGRSSLSDFVAGRLGAGEPITLFTDVAFSPLHAATLADLVTELCRRRLVGTYNAGSREGMSKHDFGVLVARQLGLSTATVTPGRSTDVPGRAARPLDLRLAVTALENALGTIMPRLQEEVERL
jgi:dTDP-4-dehydrorhamnose reductase